MTQYRVNQHYYTIQGEGCMTGTPAYFIRLQGCSVGCAWCDTRHTWAKDGGFGPVSALDLATVVVDARNTHGPFKWVVLTGGEPLEQNIEELVDALHASGFKVAVETSGAFWSPGYDDCDWRTVSPKERTSGNWRTNEKVLVAASELKFVIGTRRSLTEVYQFLESRPRGEDTVICLQPMSKLDKAVELCVNACMENGWRLSLQTHAMIGLR